MVNFCTIIPGIKTAGQSLVKKLGPNYEKVMGTVGKADLEGVKFADFAKSVEGIKGAVVKELPSGNKIVKLNNCCHLQTADIPKNVVVKFNKEGDCLMLSGAGSLENVTQGFSLRTQKGIDALIKAGVKNPGERVSTVISKPWKSGSVEFPGKRFIAENSGTPSEDAIIQAYEFPNLNGLRTI